MKNTIRRSTRTTNTHGGIARTLDVCSPAIDDIPMAAEQMAANAFEKIARVVMQREGRDERLSLSLHAGNPFADSRRT